MGSSGGRTSAAAAVGRMIVVLGVAGDRLFSAAWATTVDPKDDCEFPLELLFLQDISHSYGDDLPFLREQIPLFLNEMIQDYPSSTYGLGTFTDYPFPDVGFGAYEPRDYCFNLDVPFTANTQLIIDAYDNLYLRSGRDFPEYSASALHHVSKANYFTPRTDDDVQTVRVIMLFTDAIPHWDGDLADAASNHPGLFADPATRILFGVPSGDPMPVYTVVPNDGDATMQCGQDPADLVFEDYASLQQVGDALSETGAIVVFFSSALWRDFWDDLSQDLKDGWGITSFVGVLEDDSSDLLLRLREAINEVNEAVCNPPSTEAPTVPPTEAPTVPPTEAPTEAPSQAPTEAPEGPTIETIPTEAPTVPPTEAQPTDVPTLPGDCSNAVLDLFVVQDTTQSYSSDVPALATLASAIQAEVEANFQSPRIGYAVFRDKPVWPFGHKGSGDFCYDMVAPLLNSDEVDLAEEIGNQGEGSGVDWRECQLEAMVAASRRPESGWRVADEEDGAFVMRVMMIVTNSGYHRAGDGASSGLTNPNPGDGFADHEADDYPSISQVASAHVDGRIMPLFLVTRNVVSSYTSLGEDLVEQGVGGAAIAELTSSAAEVIQHIHDAIGDLCVQAQGGLRG